METIVGMLALMLLVHGQIDCIEHEFSITPPPTPELLRRSRKSLIRNGGEIELNLNTFFPEPSGFQECKRLRKKHFLGSYARNCTSLEAAPITTCQGICYPRNFVNGNLPSSETIKKIKQHFKCLPSKTVRKKVKIHCADDQSLTVYSIKVIKRCKCKQVNNDFNSVVRVNRNTISKIKDSVDKESKLLKAQLSKYEKILKIQ